MNSTPTPISYHQIDHDNVKALRIVLGKQTIITVRMVRGVFFGKHLWRDPEITFHPFTTTDAGLMGLYAIAMRGAQDMLRKYEEIQSRDIPNPPSSAGANTIQIKR